MLQITNEKHKNIFYFYSFATLNLKPQQTEQKKYTPYVPAECELYSHECKLYWGQLEIKGMVIGDIWATIWPEDYK